MIWTAGYRKLAQDARRLPTIENYYQGWASEGYWGIRVPHNILLFSVADPRKLGTARTTKDYHHRQVLIVPLQGSATVEVDSDAFHLLPGSVLLIRPFQLHDYRQLRGRDFCWLFITFELPTEIEGWNGGARRCPRDSLPLLTSLVRWRRQHPSNPPRSISRGAPLALMLLLTLIAAQPDDGRRRIDGSSSTVAGIIAVLTRIQASKNSSLSLGNLSRQTGISSSHLRALFRARFGVSLGRYLREYRIKKSISHLLSSSVNVTQVAALCGYTSVYSFSRAFKRTMGCSPTMYVQRMRR
jgi:AraC-like DNA-binding protein